MTMSEGAQKGAEEGARVGAQEAAKEEKQQRKALLLTGTGGYDKFKVVHTDIPEPKENEVVVRLKACGLNFAEVSMLQGLYAPMPKLPGVIGYEGAGIVEKVGNNVKNLQVGARVICAQSFGLWQEVAVLPEDACFGMPENMSFEEGAAIPINYLTAYCMLFHQAALKKGQSVLVHMAAGGVGTAAIQLCKTVSDVTIFGTASASKHETLTQMGVAYPIDYRTKDYVQEVRKVSPQGVDIVLDPLGGKDSKKGYDLLKPLGRIIHFGFANMISGERKNIFTTMRNYFDIPKYDSMSLMAANKSVSGFHLGYLIGQEGTILPAMNDILRLYTEGKIKPHIDSTWSFEEIGKAMGRIHSRQNVGKVILVPTKPQEQVSSKGASAEEAKGAPSAQGEAVAEETTKQQ